MACVLSEGSNPSVPMILVAILCFPFFLEASVRCRGFLFVAFGSMMKRKYQNVGIYDAGN